MEDNTMQTKQSYREMKETPLADRLHDELLDTRDQEATCNITLAFVKAGKAIFTVDNGKGTHYTYKVTKKEQEAGSKWEKYGPSYFVKLLVGPDNSRDYTYMGMLKSHEDILHNTTIQVVKLTKASKFTNDSTPVQVFNFAMRVLDQLQGLPAGYSIQHDGLCGRCGRHLTDPESLRTGMGPICRGED
jgi:hypothetical protein